MKRDSAKLMDRPDPLRTAVVLPIGSDGEYYVGSRSAMGQDFSDISVINDSEPPGSQPGLWCGWTPDRTGAKLTWNRKISEFDPNLWIRYIIDHFLDKWGIVCNGVCTYSYDSDSDDVHTLEIGRNHVTLARGSNIVVRDRSGNVIYSGRGIKK